MLHVLVLGRMVVQLDRLILQVLSALLLAAFVCCAGMAILSFGALALSFAPFFRLFGHPDPWFSAGWIAAAAVLFGAHRVTLRLIRQTNSYPGAASLSRLATSKTLEKRTPQRLWLPVAWVTAILAVTPLLASHSVWPGVLGGALFVAAFAAPLAIGASLAICSRQSRLGTLSFADVLKTFLTVAVLFAFATPAVLSIAMVASSFIAAPVASDDSRRLAGAVLVPIGTILVGAPVGLLVGLPLAAIAALAGSLVAFRRTIPPLGAGESLAE
ncbi:hypothetical protein [Brevundimonas sp.]|uniref:hypothetical protein n=1 Tax=Brevundimonas sp. TaxID=1871086 RepID=UPI002D371585|nr:hypothetical protein [Brevundimonas sp.]HYD26342.1 hypothetical protein [Brevundimonas sp.]